MLEDQIPELEVEINPHMSNQEYIDWNVINAARRLGKAPEEMEITLSVYNLHKHILKSRGVAESEFIKGDKLMEEAVAIVKARLADYN